MIEFADNFLFQMTTEANFFLIGYNYKTDIQFTYNAFDFKITLINQEPNHPRLLDYKETARLSITGAAEEVIHLELAQSVKNLLSLAVGRRIIFNRQVYSVNDINENVFREMSPPTNEGSPIIPDFKLNKFLFQTFPKYESLSKTEKNQFFVVTDYLNQTKNGFIEDRILHTTIAWETLSDYFKINCDLPIYLKDLRKEIKSSYKRWKKLNPDLDPNGEIGSRLLTAIDREKLLDKLINLTAQFNLNYQKLGIDFHELKGLRDYYLFS